MDSQYPIPEGYIKSVEKTAVLSYRVPTDIASKLKESVVVSVEILDEIISS